MTFSRNQQEVKALSLEFFVCDRRGGREKNKEREGGREAEREEGGEEKKEGERDREAETELDKRLTG